MRKGQGTVVGETRAAGTAVRAGAPSRVGNLPTSVREDFPLLAKPHPSGNRLVYLDSASTTQKPRGVIEAVRRVYEEQNANVHRGVYALSAEATAAYEGARAKIASFLGAASPTEVVFTRNATEGINLLASAVGSPKSPVGHGPLRGGQPVKPRGPRGSTGWAVGNGDTILLTAMEHHSNLVPWQEAARRTGATLDFVELTPEFQLDLDDFRRKLTPHVKLVAVTHMSNVLGTVNPVAEIVARAHAVGARVLVDAAQSVARMPVDVSAWDADVVVCSGHKMYGPTGIGVLYGKRELLDAMPPFLRGGDMVKTVTREGATWNDLPWKFEAGTPHIAGAIGLGAAVDTLQRLGRERIWQHEQELVAYALPKLHAVPGLTLYGPVTGERGAVFSFRLDSVHSHDLASFLDERGIAIRGGHHCAMPLMETLRIRECARASGGIYTSTEDLDLLVQALHEARELFRR